MFVSNTGPDEWNGDAIETKFWQLVFLRDKPKQKPYGCGRERVENIMCGISGVNAYLKRYLKRIRILLFELRARVRESDRERKIENG